MSFENDIANIKNGLKEDMGSPQDKKCACGAPAKHLHDHLPCCGNPDTCCPPPDENESYEDKVKRLAKEAHEYYSRCKISPTGDEIVSYVADCVEDDSGYMDDDGYRYIAKILGITLDESKLTKDESVSKPKTNEADECPSSVPSLNGMHRKDFGDFKDIEKDMNKNVPETLKVDQSQVRFKKDNAFVARESVDFRHLLNGINKDIKENYPETCGICPDEKVCNAEPSEETIKAVEDTIAKSKMGEETAISAARNDQVEQNMKDLKQEVGQNNAQEQADSKQPTVAPQTCETEKVEVIVEEPKEKMVLDEPKGEISTTEAKKSAKNTKDEEEMCSCGKYPVEKGYRQCTKCLDVASAEKYRHENEAKVEEEYTTSSDTSGQPANAAAAKEDVKKSAARSKAIDFRSRKANKGLGYQKQAQESKVEELNIADMGAVKLEMERIKSRDAKVKADMQAQDTLKSKKRIPKFNKTKADFEAQDTYKSESKVTEESDPWLPHLSGTCMVCGKPAKIAGDRGDEYCSIECQKKPAPKSEFRPISYATDLGVVGRPPALESNVDESGKKNKIPFIQAMAEQEEATDGKYTGTHWRDEYRKWKADKANGNESKIDEKDKSKAISSIKNELVKLRKQRSEAKKTMNKLKMSGLEAGAEEKYKKAEKDFDYYDSLISEFEDDLKDMGKAKEPKVEEGAYDVMRGQAGSGRVIIRWKYIDSPGTMSSHFASVEDFLTQKGNDTRKIEWYQVGNGEKVAMTESKVVSLNEDLGGYDNCNCGAPVEGEVVNGSVICANCHNVLRDIAIGEEVTSPNENGRIVKVENDNVVVQWDSGTKAYIPQSALKWTNGSWIAEAKMPAFGVSELSDFRSMFEGIEKERKTEKIVFNDPMMQSQYEDLLRRHTPAEAKRMVLKAHKEYYGDSAKFYGVGESKVNEDTVLGLNSDEREKYLKNLQKQKEKETKGLNVNDSKINEYDAFPGGGTGTVAADASSIPPLKNEGEKIPDVAKAQNPETHDENEKQPEADEHGEKEYFGKQGDDNYYYLLAVSDEGEGSQAGMASEPKPNVEPDVKPAEEAPVESEARPKAPEIATAKESKIEEGGEDSVKNYIDKMLKSPKHDDEHIVRSAVAKFGCTAKQADAILQKLLFPAKESKAEEGVKNVDVPDDDFWKVKSKLKGPTGDELDDKDMEVIRKISKQRTETEDLNRMYKMNNTKVPNEAKTIMRIPKAWHTKKIVEALSKMLLNEGYSSLQVVDATGKVVADAKEQDLDPNNIKDFLLKNMDDLELTEITPDIVKKYLLADEQSTKDDEMTQTPEEEKTIKNQGEPPRKGEEVAPGETVASESKVDELQECKCNEYKEDNPMMTLLEKFGLVEKELSGYKCCPCGWEGDAKTDICPNCQQKLDPNYRGEAQESIVDSLLEKFELTEPVTIESLLEKFRLNEADPVVFKSRPAGEELKDKDLTGQAVAPEGTVSKEPAPPEAGTATAVAEPLPAAPGPEAPMGAGQSAAEMPGGPAAPIGPVQAQDMSTPESARAYIQSEYPEEPFTSTAIAFADSAIADPKVYGGVRKTQWDGIWGDKDTLEKQAKIVGEYGTFSTDSVKAITDKFGNTAKYKLARDVRPVIFVTVRDVGAGIEPISISELKGLSGAREVVQTENPGEVKIIY